MLLKEALEHHGIKKSTSAWWSMLALISILSDMAREELQSEYIKTLFPEMSLGFVHSFIISS